jgi:hypothetical protein
VSQLVDIAGNVERVRAQIAVAAKVAGREPSSVELVAAAKGQPVEAVRAAVEAGVVAVGHNYVQELRTAVAGTSELVVSWHYIGALRSGTAHNVADLADVVETVSSERPARRLAGRAARNARRIGVLLEVDFTQARTGAPPAQVPALADLVASLEGLRLRGLMTVPPLGESAEAARPWFARLRELRERIRRDHPDLLDLSMGMSLDYAVAVEEGATMVRIGTALFGPRTP